MLKNLKIRIYTSLILLFLLSIMLINNYILGYLIMLVGIFSLLEFFNFCSIIFNKKKIKQLLINLIFILYIFSLCSALLILSSYIYLKIVIFIVLLICVASDIGGFVFGKIFKGPKLTKVSPNKTISGAIGSLVFSCIFASILIYYVTKSYDPLILIAACTTSVACQIGDLFFSFIKRKSKLKDSSNFLPGHGGFLDRVDGILLGLPVGFLTLITIY